MGRQKGSYPPVLGAFPVQGNLRLPRAGNRAIRLYLLPGKPGKRIPLLSLALLNAQSALSLGVLLRKTPGRIPPLRGFGFAVCFKTRTDFVDRH
jgi:hypothetical protein